MPHSVGIGDVLEHPPGLFLGRLTGAIPSCVRGLDVLRARALLMRHLGITARLPFDVFLQ